MDSTYRFDGMREGVKIMARQLAATAYSPSTFVKIGHQMPHVDPYTQTQTSGEFDTTQDYFLSVATTPIVLLALGLFSCIIFVLLLVTRCCFRCMSCAPNEDDYLKRPYNGDRLAWANKTVKTRRIVLGFFVAFLLLALAADHALHWGNAELDSGVSVAMTSLTTLSNFFSALYTDTQALSEGFGDMSEGVTALTTASCSYLSTLSATLESGETSTQTLADLLKPLPNYINKGNTYLTEYMIGYRTTVVYIFYAFIVVNLLLYSIVVYLRQTRMMKVLLFLTWWIVFLLTIICCIEMIFVIFLGDLCIDPITYILKPLPAGTVSDSVTYFTSCEGTNPFATSTDGVTSALTTIKSLLIDETPLASTAAVCTTRDERTARFKILDALCGTCSGYFEDASYTYSFYSSVEKYTSSKPGIDSTMTSLKSSITDCASLQTSLTGVFEGSLCGGIYSGFFVIWITQFITSFCLFLLMCCGSVLYQYFDNKYWTLGIDGHYQGGEGFSPTSIEETAVVNVDSNSQYPSDALVYNAREVEMK